MAKLLSINFFDEEKYIPVEGPKYPCSVCIFGESKDWCMGWIQHRIKDHKSEDTLECFRKPILALRSLPIKIVLELSEEDQSKIVGLTTESITYYFASGDRSHVEIDVSAFHVILGDQKPIYESLGIWEDVKNYIKDSLFCPGIQETLQKYKNKDCVVCSICGKEQLSDTVFTDTIESWHDGVNYKKQIYICGDCKNILVAYSLAWLSPFANDDKEEST